jgi:hypothetical protein
MYVQHDDPMTHMALTVNLPKLKLSIENSIEEK